MTVATPSKRARPPRGRGEPHTAARPKAGMCGAGARPRDTPTRARQSHNAGKSAKAGQARVEARQRKGRRKRRDGPEARPRAEEGPRSRGRRRAGEERAGDARGHGRAPTDRRDEDRTPTARRNRTTARHGPARQQRLCAADGPARDRGRAEPAGRRQTPRSCGSRPPRSCGSRPGTCPRGAGLRPSSPAGVVVGDEDGMRLLRQYRNLISD